MRQEAREEDLARGPAVSTLQKVTRMPTLPAQPRMP